MNKSDPELNKRRGKRLTECRNTAGLTQKELAERLNYTKQTISNIETGARGLTPYMAMLIGEELAVDPDYLLCNTDIASSKQFFTDNMSEGAKAPVKSQILYDLIKANPNCVKIGWCLNGAGDKTDWGWHIDALIRVNGDMDKYKGIHLDIADQIRWFDALSDFVGYQLYKQSYNPHSHVILSDGMFDFAFSGETGAGYSAEEYQKEVDRMEEKNRAIDGIEEPVYYDEFKKQEKKKAKGKDTKRDSSSDK